MKANTVKYSETHLCWPPLVPFKAAQLIQVDNLNGYHLTLWKLNCVINCVSLV